MEIIKNGYRQQSWCFMLNEEEKDNPDNILKI